MLPVRKLLLAFIAWALLSFVSIDIAIRIDEIDILFNWISKKFLPKIAWLTILIHFFISVWFSYLNFQYLNDNILGAIFLISGFTRLHSLFPIINRIHGYTHNNVKHNSSLQ